jgi:hypothetical protein
MGSGVCRLGRGKMMTPDELWQRVKSCFEDDDGSLPAIAIEALSGNEVGSLYEWIRANSRLYNNGFMFWDNGLDRERQLDEVPNAAILVAQYLADPFHFSVEGLTIDGVPLPCLGVFVFQDSIEFDYRMGADWGPPQVVAFFRLLKRLLSATKHGIVAPAECEGPPYPQDFTDAFNAFVNS